jgi:hypothetical protein
MRKSLLLNQINIIFLTFKIRLQLQTLELKSSSLHWNKIS